MAVDLAKLEALIANVKPGVPFDPAPLQAEIDAIKTAQTADEADIAALNKAVTDTLTNLTGATPDVPAAVATLQAATS